KRADSFRLSVGHEVNGGALNGSETTSQRLRLDAAKDDLIGVNDNWTFSGASGLKMNEARATLALPVRWMNFNLVAGFWEGVSPIASRAELYTRKFNAGFDASAILRRTGDFRLGIEAGFTWRNMRRWINAFELSPEIVSAGRV